MRKGTFGILPAGLMLIVGVFSPTAIAGAAAAILAMGRCASALLRNQNELILDPVFLDPLRKEGIVPLIIGQLIETFSIFWFLTTPSSLWAHECSQGID